jgi:hypothetical protein
MSDEQERLDERRQEQEVALQELRSLVASLQQQLQVRGRPLIKISQLQIFQFF